LIGRTQSIGVKKRRSQLVTKMSFLPKNFWSKRRIGWCFCVTLVVLLFIIVISIEVPKSEKKGKHHQILQGFAKDFNITWAPDHTALLDNDQILELKLDNTSGSAFRSINQFLFGNITMQIKLVPNNSAGTVTAYYLSSPWTQPIDTHDELDFEFLGNLSGQPYILQTNVFANGTGDREQRLFLWFDPTTDFHTYGILWNHRQIVFLVDNVPIRLFTNNEVLGLAYPDHQPMNIYSSLWNGEQWATQGGRIKIDWAAAPFIATYTNYNLDACVAEDANAPCASFAANNWWDGGAYQILSADQIDKLRWVEQNYMVYDYCTDTKRYNVTPVECAQNSGGLA
jgi:xyloglucan:xyloglucosyl transferase